MEKNSIEGVLAFLDSLPAGFSRAPRQRMMVRELLLRLIDRGSMPPEASGLRNLLAPVVCTTAEQQREFYTLFEEWVRPMEPTRPVSVADPRRWPWVLVGVLLVAAIVCGGYLYSVRHRPNAATTMQQEMPSTTVTNSVRSARELQPNSIEGLVLPPDAAPIDLSQSHVRLSLRVPADEHVFVKDSGQFSIALLSSSSGKDETIWLQPRATYLANQQVRAIAFSPDSRLLAAAGSKATVELWDTKTGLVRMALSDTELGYSRPETFRSNSAGRTGLARKGDFGGDTMLGFSPDGRKLFSGYGRALLVRDLASIRVEDERFDFDVAIDGAAVSPNGKELAVASLKDHTLRYYLQGPKGPILPFRIDGSVLAFSPDGSTLAIYKSPDSKIYDVWGHKIRGSLGLGESTTGMTFSADNERLSAYSGLDTTIWDVRSRRYLNDVLPLGKSVALSPDGRWFISSLRGELLISDITTGRLVWDTNSGHSEIDRIAFSPDGQLLAVANSDNTVKLFDVVLTSKGAVAERASGRQIFPALSRPSEKGYKSGPGVDAVRDRSKLHPGTTAISYLDREEPYRSDSDDYPLLVTHADYEPAYLDHARPGPVIARLGSPHSQAKMYALVRPSPLRRYPRWVSAVTGLALAGAGLASFLALRQRLKQRRALLDKWETHMDLKPAVLHSRSEEDLLFDGPEVAALAVRLRRPQARPVSSLAIDRTIRRTVAHAGMFSPVKGTRKAGREYLALLESSGRYDQRASYWKCFLRRMEKQGVWLDVYHFSGDPRSCRTTNGDTAATRLEEISSIHPNHTLWMLIETERFFHRNTRESVAWVPSLTHWQRRTVVGLTEGTTEDLRELDALGFGFTPADTLEAESLAEAARGPLEAADSTYPPLLKRNETQWLHGPLPKGEAGGRALRSLHRQLRLWLGTDGYYCLLACALYPGLAWNLTLHWSLRLLPEATREETLGRLVRLPWFRYSRMPQELRASFLKELPLERHKECLAVLDEFLEAKKIPEQGPAASSLEVLRMAGANEEDSPLPTRDYVFLSFLLGKTPRQWRLQAPEWLTNILFPNGLPQLGINPAFWLLLGLMTGVAAYKTAERYAYPPKNLMPAHWERVQMKEGTAAPTSELSAVALEIAASRLESLSFLYEDFAGYVYKEAAAFAGDKKETRELQEARPGAIYTPKAGGDAGIVEHIIPNEGLVLIQPHDNIISRVFLEFPIPPGRFEEPIASPPLVPEDYDKGERTLHRLIAEEPGETTSGSQAIRGDRFEDQDRYSYAIYDPGKTLLLRPGSGLHAKRAAVATVPIPEDGYYSVSGGFVTQEEHAENVHAKNLTVRVFAGDDPRAPSLFNSTLHGATSIEPQPRRFLHRGEKLNFAVEGAGEKDDPPDSYVRLHFTLSSKDISKSFP